MEESSINVKQNKNLRLKTGIIFSVKTENFPP